MRPPGDPIERIVFEGLRARGVEFRVDGQGGYSGLDFYVPEMDLHIEVKQFNSPRIAEQMSRFPNVIVIQGEAAARAFVALITPPAPR